MKRKSFRINENGYSEGKPEHSPAIHRQVAYKEIYLKNRHKYPLKFSEYVIHHIDGEKLNGSVKNLYICTQKEHNFIHEEQRRKKQKFQTAKEIDNFLAKRKAEGNKTIKSFYNKEYINPSPYGKIKLKISPNTPKDNFYTKDYSHNVLSSYNQNFNRKRKNKIDKYIKTAAIIAVIIIFIWSFWGRHFFEDISTSTQNMSISKQQNNQPTELSDLIVEGSKTEVVIKNNLEKDISINVTYRIYSNWFGIDLQESRIFEVEAKEEKSFKVYDNDGCLTAPCSVSIISYEEI